ncbi:AbrB/MazE/SpoVT family DNA-binding domain-containing protein [Mitsuaria sp. CC2]|uniref:AbrB/MazE/SpoVT family DNA-binding domain-containing protein n=1 Tax=Mitsuaria sp. CC2 TaxID=3029186 RepID=UPI003B8C2EA4
MASHCFRTVGPIATIDEGLQITIPEKVLEALRIGPGDKVEFFHVAADEFLFYVATRPLPGSGILPVRVRRPVTIDEMNHTFSSMERAELKALKRQRKQKK